MRRGEQKRPARFGQLIEISCRKRTADFSVGLFLFKCHQRMGTYLLKVIEVPAVHLLNM